MEAFNVHRETDGLYNYVVTYTDTIDNLKSIVVAGFDTKEDAETFLHHARVQLCHRYTFMSH